MTELITISTLNEKLKEIEARFNEVTRNLVQARDEQIRLRGEFDALTKLKAELEKEEKKEA
jgi:septal ring factor EnvC (AmiA/AmiB activator)